MLTQRLRLRPFLLPCRKEGIAPEEESEENGRVFSDLDQFVKEFQKTIIEDMQKGLLDPIFYVKGSYTRTKVVFGFFY